MNNKGYVITENAVTSKPVIIDENSSVVKFKCELQESDAPNRNGRIYSKEAIDSGMKHCSVV